jgi:hypothetical protein
VIQLFRIKEAATIWRETCIETGIAFRHITFAMAS